MSEDARATCPSRKPFSKFFSGNALLPGRPPSPTVAQGLYRPSPEASGGAGVCDFAPCAPHVLLPRAMPHSALRARLAPVFRRLTMRPARLRRAAVPEDARVARPSRKPFSQFSAGSTSLPGRPPLPNVFLARRLWRRGALPCATLPLARRVCSRRALCHIVRFARVSIRSSAS